MTAQTAQLPETAPTAPGGDGKYAPQCPQCDSGLLFDGEGWNCVVCGYGRRAPAERETRTRAGVPAVPVSALVVLGMALGGAALAGMALARRWRAPSSLPVRLATRLQRAACGVSRLELRPRVTR